MILAPATPAKLSAIARALLAMMPPPCPHDWEPVWTWDGTELLHRCRLCGEEQDPE